MSEAAAAAAAAAEILGQAKRALAPGKPLRAWKVGASSGPELCHTIADEQEAVRVGPNRFVDGHERLGCEQFNSASEFGDNLPTAPAVLVGCCEHWAAFAPQDLRWGIADLASRITDPARKVSLDGGPGFARLSLARGLCSLSQFARYSASTASAAAAPRSGGGAGGGVGGGGTAEEDSAPLYIFDPDILNATFDAGQPVHSEYATPRCFTHDAMSGCTGSRFRPLPPAWLLVGPPRSGTPIHDHPMTVAWNALLVGCKLWCCFPPATDEDVLLLLSPASDGGGDGGSGGGGGGGDSGDGGGDDSDSDSDSDDDCPDLSALQWFGQCDPKVLARSGAEIIVQRPGEVVFVPAGWWHVVLNVEQSTAISSSLALRRDIPRLLPDLFEEDAPFAQHWRGTLAGDADYADVLAAAAANMAAAAAAES